MNRTSTALLAALEALIAVAIGIGISLVPLTVLWATTFGLGADFLLFWQASVDIWLLGHGVDLAVQLPAAVAATTGLPGAEQPFPVTIAVLGFTVLTALLGVRAGRRSALSGPRMLGVLVAVAVFAALAALAASTAGTALVQPARLQALLLPSLVYGVAVFASSEWAMQQSTAARRDPLSRAIRTTVGDWPPAVTAGIATTVRGATAAVAGLIAVAAVLVALSIVTRYATITALYETLQTGALGGTAITLLQLALLPNAIIFGTAWLVGPGFAVGVGSSITPAGTVLGPVPGLPLVGALPEGAAALGLLVVLIPVLLGFAAGRFTPLRMPHPLRPGQLVVVGAGMGLLAGVALGLLAWWSGGAVGPGRLAQIGPDPLLVGALAAVEIGAPAVIGMLLAGRRRADGIRRPQEAEDEAMRPLG